MIWHKNAKRWNKAEKARADRMAVEIGCIFCWLDDGHAGPCDERHHIKDGNKRMGHWFTLPCCNKHHEDCHNGKFGHAVQIDRWLKVQHALGLDDSLPPTKIFPRKGYVEANHDLVEAQACQDFDGHPGDTAGRATGDAQRGVEEK